MRAMVPVLILALVFSGPVPVRAQEAPSEPLEEPADDLIPGGIQGFVSLDLRGIDVIDALKYLSQKASLDIVTTKGVQGRVTLMVENVPVRDVFDIMLRSNRLAYDKTGDIYNVMTEEEYKALYGKPFSDTRIVKAFRLNYAIPEQAFNLFDTMKSDIGRVLVDAESGNVLVIDIPSRINDMTVALLTFDQKNEVRIFPLQYAKAKDVEEQLKLQLDVKKVGLIKADERANQLMVQTLPERMKEIERLIRELDRKTLQVIIDTTIIKVNFSDSKTKGMEWEGLFDVLDDKLTYVGSTPFTTVNPSTTAGEFTSRLETYRTEGGVGSYPFSGTTSALSSSAKTVGAETLHVGLVGKQDFDVLLRYVQRLGSTKILSNPKLVVTNNQESRIHVGEKQAYVTTTTTTGQVSNTVAENVTFVDVGVQLSVTPTINQDGFVTMKVKAEVSSVSSTLITPSQNRIPIINSSLAETTVMVKEGVTIVLGGLRQDQKITATRQTPFISHVPLIGNLFKTDTTSFERSELMILLTPRIITGEVFVGESGQKVEEPGIKKQQSYEDAKSASMSAANSAALAQTRPLLKGMKESP